MKALFFRLCKSTVVHVLFAFVMMGSWSVYANWAHPMPKPIVAGVVQGAMSGMLTLLSKGSVDRLRPMFSYAVGFWAPPLIAAIVSAGLLVSIHWITGTPEILTTIAVPITIAVSYIFIYNVLRQRSGGKTHG